jgi:predicted NodU family carbamoyl transferase
MNILGLSAFFHESACCLLRDGRLVAAADRRTHRPCGHVVWGWTTPYVPGSAGV